MLNYSTKTDLKNATGVDTSKFVKKVDLANLKYDVDKLDIIDKLKNVSTNLNNLESKVDKTDVDKLVPVPVDLSKLSDVVKNHVVKKDVYDKLITKVNSTDTSGFVLKSKYDTDKSELKSKIPDTSGLVRKTNYDAKIAEIEGKIPDVSNLSTKTALTTVENKVRSVSNLVKKTDYDKKIYRN